MLYLLDIFFSEKPVNIGLQRFLFKLYWVSPRLSILLSGLTMGLPMPPLELSKKSRHWALQWSSFQIF